MPTAIMFFQTTPRHSIFNFGLKFGDPVKFILHGLLSCYKGLTFAAAVVKLVDTPDLGSGVERRGGSSPSSRTIYFRE